MKKLVVLVLIVLMCSPAFAIKIDIDETKPVDQPTSDIDIIAPSKLKSKVTRHVYGLGHVADVTNGEVTYLHQDRLGSTRLMTDSEGEVVGEFKSLPFGQEIVNNDVRYSFATGKELDSSGLYYFGARYYDPNIGRFTSVDPVRDNHAYSYVGNNPMNYVDPSGMYKVGRYDYQLHIAETEHDVPHIDVYEGRYNKNSKVVAKLDPLTGDLLPKQTGALINDNPDVANPTRLKEDYMKKVFTPNELELRNDLRANIKHRFLSSPDNIYPVLNPNGGSKRLRNFMRRQVSSLKKGRVRVGGYAGFILGVYSGYEYYNEFVSSNNAQRIDLAGGELTSFGVSTAGVIAVSGVASSRIGSFLIGGVSGFGGGIAGTVMYEGLKLNGRQQNDFLNSGRSGSVRERRDDAMSTASWGGF